MLAHGFVLPLSATAFDLAKEDVHFVRDFIPRIEDGLQMFWVFRKFAGRNCKVCCGSEQLIFGLKARSSQFADQLGHWMVRHLGCRKCLSKKAEVDLICSPQSRINVFRVLLPGAFVVCDHEVRRIAHQLLDHRVG